MKAFAALIMLFALLCVASAVSVRANVHHTLSMETTLNTAPGEIFANGTILFGGRLLSMSTPEGMSARNFTECAPVQCMNEGTCQNGRCTCRPGFSGNNCEIDACDRTICNKGSTCEHNSAGVVCVADQCFGINCQNEGQCFKGTCSCINGFSGPFCQTHPCNLTKCLNGGICALPGKCICRNNFFGDNCQNDGCSAIKCENGGRCKYGKCYCTSEWAGDKCDLPSSAAKDHKLAMNFMHYAEKDLNKVIGRFNEVYESSTPAAIERGFGAAFDKYQKTLLQEAKDKSKRDLMSPKVIGLKPIYRDNLKMPNTPYENARIYEDQSLAYHLGHEVRHRPLVEANELLNRTFYDGKFYREIANKDVPGAEYFTSPMGFIDVNTRYNPSDDALLQDDLQKYRHENAETAQSILQAEDLLI